MAKNRLGDEVKGQGGRMTHQRQAVLDAVLSAPGEHLTPEEIADILKDQDKAISLATVYRTLAMLDQMGFLKKIYLKDSVKYEARLEHEKHCHHHLVCEECGAIVEIKEGFIGSLHGDALDELELAIEQEHQFRIADHDLQFFGICKACSQKS